MEFTASDGFVFFERDIRLQFSIFIESLDNNGYAVILPWHIEFTEWFLNKNIGYQETNFNCYEIYLHQDITEDDLEQIRQLIDYLEL